VAFIVRNPVEAHARPYGRRWPALGVLCLSLLVVVMANTSLIVALPDMTADLELHSHEMQWLVDGYTVPYAALMLLFGTLGDRFGRRRALIAGLVVFGAGSLLGALADSTEAVIAARFTMGVSAAVIMPATLSLLVAIFPRTERGRAISIWAATSGLAIAVGPLVSGALLAKTGWSSTFLVNVPLVAVAIVAALALIPPSRVESRQPLDYLGGIYSIVAIGTLVYAVIDGFHVGWGTLQLSLLALAALTALLFVRRQLRHPAPLLDVRKLADRAVGGSSLAVMLLFLSAFAVIYYVAQYLQAIFGYGPLETGIRLLPLAVAVTIGSLLSGILMRWVSGKWLIVTGMLLGAGGVLTLTQADASSTYFSYLVALSLLGLGMGLSEPPATDTIMGGFNEGELGAAGGLNDTAIELGGSLGIAFLGSILATTYDERLVAETAGQTAAVPEALRGQVDGALERASDSVGAGAGVAEHLASDPNTATLADMLMQSVTSSYAEAVVTTSWVAGLVLAVGAVAVALILPRNLPGGHHDADGEERSVGADGAGGGDSADSQHRRQPVREGV
jgi:EmrB/QacA subfamily drug resistance transporter